MPKVNDMQEETQNISIEDNKEKSFSERLQSWLINSTSNNAPDELGATLKEALNTIRGQRQQDYGAPDTCHEMIADMWNVYLEGGERNLESWDVALMMVLLKVCRARRGGYTHDSFVDICGYSAIADFMVQKDRMLQESCVV